MTVLLAVAVAAALAAVATAAVLAVLLRRTRRELADLRASVRPVEVGGPADVAGRLVRTVVQGATRLREQGVTETLSASLDDLVQWARADRARIVRIADDEGCVTLLFSDIEDSTALNERLGDAEWVRTLEIHDRLVRRAIETRDGLVVKTVGDGFMAVFGDPAQAVRAALDVQHAMAVSRGRRLRRAGVAVRVGVHRGRAVSSGGDWFGRDVALCARIAAHARGGQTLASAATVAAGGKPAGVTVTALGALPFKGIAEPVEVVALAADGPGAGRPQR